MYAGLAFFLIPVLNFLEYSVSHSSNKFIRMLYRIGLMIDPCGDPTSGILNPLVESIYPALKLL